MDTLKQWRAEKTLTGNQLSSRIIPSHQASQSNQLIKLLTDVISLTYHAFSFS